MNINTRNMNFVTYNGQEMEWVKFNGVIVYEGWKTLTAQGVPPLTLVKCKGEDLINYRIYGNSVQKNLPDEYQEVEWVAGDDSGKPMIVVGEVSSINTVIKFNAKLKRVNGGSGYPAFLSTLNYSNTQLLINQHPQIGTEAFFYVTFGNISDKYDNIYNGCQPTQNFYDYELSRKGLSVKNYGAITFNATSFSTANICIIGKANNNSKSDAYFRSFKVYDGTTLIYDLKPCYRKSDGVIGMYDVVTDRFLTNSREGSLTKGADVPSSNVAAPIRNVGDNPIGLPAGYQQVEYIQSTGTQHIDTAFVPNQDTKILMNINVANPEYCRLYGAYYGASWTASSYGAYFNAYGNTFWVNYNSDTNIPDFGIQTNVDCKIYQDKNKFYVNDTLKYTLDTQNAFTPGRTMYLMALNRDSESRKGEFKLYNCKIWDDNVLVRDYVPCYRKRDNVIGLYDLVYGIFHENAGTGTFLKGNDVNNYKVPIEITGLNKADQSISNDYRVIYGVPVEAGEKITYIVNYAQYSSSPTAGITPRIYQDEAMTTVLSTYPTITTYDEDVVVTLTAQATGYFSFAWGYAKRLLDISKMFVAYGEYTARDYQPYVSPTTVDISLTEPLRKVGDYADYIDFENQKVYRNVVVNNDTGTLSIDQSYSGTTDNVGTSVVLPNISSIKGTTIYSVETKTQPSNLYIKYKGK